MFEKLKSIQARYDELCSLLSDPNVISDQEKYRALSKEQASLEEIVEAYGRYLSAKEQLDALSPMLSDADADIRAMAEDEKRELGDKLDALEEELKILLIPGDPNDNKNVILEIRAGTGGEEAALFGADLLRMYARYAERRGFKAEFLSDNSTNIGGVKEVILSISGKKAYSRLKFESGVHRVQRVPETESQGRIHTSAVTVAILPEADEVDLTIDPSELRIDTYRSSGAGGQHVNKTESAIRITHLPTGLVVTCQDEKSQHKNKAKALTVLRARLLDKSEQERQDKISQDRKNQVGSGDRSERIRTYNFPQGRVTDHRINLTLYQLEMVINGKLDDIILPLIAHNQAERLKEIQ
ncbi:MAG TPA: peptide chain release factor 1 [Desulfobulbaceae bacterium]|nr:peptide chain release factor 1 [Desulfobulbaceae bacterium]